MSADPNLIQSGNYNDMIIAGDAQRAITSNDEDVILELHIGGQPGNNTLIGRWAYDAGAATWQPTIPILLSRVTDSQYGEQIADSPTTGITRIVAPGHSLPGAGYMTVWSRLDSAEIATSFAFLVDGDTVTFTKPYPPETATGDVFHVEGSCEFGELREKINGGLWSPRQSPAGVGSDILAVWDGGLRAQAGTGTIDEGIEISFAGKPSESKLPAAIQVAAIIDIAEASAGVGSKIGVGHTSGNNFRCGGSGIVHNITDVWAKLFFGANFSGYTIARVGEFAAPGTVFGTRFLWSLFGHGDNEILQYCCQCSIAPGRGVATPAVVKDGLGAGISPLGLFGPVDGVLFMLSLENGGAIEGTMSQLETKWIST